MSFKRSPSANLQKSKSTISPEKSPSSRTSLTYLPTKYGLSNASTAKKGDYDLDTARALLDSQSKIVLLTSEVERLTKLNYTLVKESQIFTGDNLGPNENVLQNRLSVALAENNKLSELVVKLVKQRPEDLIHTEALMYELTDYKKRYLTIEPQYFELQDKLRLLSSEKENLINDIKVKDKKISDTINGNIALAVENNRLRNDLQGLYEANAKLREISYNAHEADETQKRLEDRIKILVDELTTVKQQLVLKDHENRTLIFEATRAKSLDMSLNALADDYTKQIEANKNKSVEAEKAMIEKSQLTVENLKLNGAVNRLSNENANLKKSADNLALTSTLNDELKRQVKHFQEDNQRLNTLLVNKIGECDDLRDQLDQLERVNKENQNLTIENSVLARRIDNQNQELVEERQKTRQLNESLIVIESLNHQLNQLNGENKILRSTSYNLDENLKKTSSELKDAQNTIQVKNYKIQDLVEDNKRLIENVQSKNLENEVVNNRLKESQVLVRELEDLKPRHLNITQDNVTLSRALHDKIVDIDAMKRKAAELEKTAAKVEDLDGTVKILVDEIQKYKIALETKNIEVEDLLRTVANLQRLLKEAEKIKEQVILLAQENDRLTHILHDRLLETDKLKKNNSDLERKVHLTAVEADLHRSQVLETSKENKHLKDTTYEVMSEIETLKRQLSDYHNSHENQVDQATGKLKNLITQMDSRKYK